MGSEAQSMFRARRAAPLLALSLAVVLLAPSRSTGHEDYAHADGAHAHTLVIHPLSLAYAGYLGGNTTDQAFSVVVDAAGNTYVAGSTESANFPAVNALQPALKGATDAFVGKISADGTTLKYSTYLGGSGLDAATGIALDGGGNIYVTGYTNSKDFPVTPGVVQNHINGKLFDAFVAKISPTGALLYSTYLGGTYLDAANAIAVDAAGNAHVAGYTCSFDFPTKKAFQPFLDGGPPGCFTGQDAFVTKLNATATALIYSTFLGGSDREEATAIALDANGRAAIAGYTASNDFPTAGVPLMGFSGGLDAFAGRLDTGGALEYATYFGGADDDTATGIAVGNAGDFYVSGYTASADLPAWNAFQPTLAGPEDGFVLRMAFTATNATVAYATYLGGGDSDRLHAIAVDAGGNAYVAGYTESIDFPTFAPTQPGLNGARDAIVARLNPAGMPTFSTFLGGSDDDIAWHLAIHSMPGNTPSIYVAGETLSLDLGTDNAFEPHAQGGSDGFVARIAPSP